MPGLGRSRSRGDHVGVTGSEHNGRTAVVTGAARGIGAAASRALAGRGARVVLVARSAEELERVADGIRSEGGDAVALAADLTGPDWLADLDGVAPEVDLLVNNAASFAPYGPLEEVSAEHVRNVLEVGVESALWLTQRVMGGMKERGFGRIVSVGSVAATHGAGGQVAYATAKAALAGMTRTLAVEGGRSGVTANLVELGLVETERVETEIDPVIRERLVGNTAIGRAGTPEEIARVIAFLCSEESAYITGAVIPVSGGLGLALYPEQFPEGGRPNS